MRRTGWRRCLTRPPWRLALLVLVFPPSVLLAVAVHIRVLHFFLPVLFPTTSIPYSCFVSSLACFRVSLLVLFILTAFCSPSPICSIYWCCCSCSSLSTNLYNLLHEFCFRPYCFPVSSLFYLLAVLFVSFFRALRISCCVSLL